MGFELFKDAICPGGERSFRRSWAKMKRASGTGSVTLARSQRRKVQYASGFPAAVEQLRASGRACGVSRAPEPQRKKEKKRASYTLVTYCTHQQVEY